MAVLESVGLTLAKRGGQLNSTWLSRRISGLVARSQAKSASAKYQPYGIDRDREVQPSNIVLLLLKRMFAIKTSRVTLRADYQSASEQSVEPEISSLALTPLRSYLCTTVKTSRLEDGTQDFGLVGTISRLLVEKLCFICLVTFPDVLFAEARA